MQQRRYSRNVKTFQDRLAEEAQRLREEAERIPRGAARDLLLSRAREVEAVSHMNAWLTSSGSRSLK